jgi:hypothetical protein
MELTKSFELQEKYLMHSGGRPSRKRRVGNFVYTGVTKKRHRWLPIFDLAVYGKNLRPAAQRQSAAQLNQKSQLTSAIIAEAAGS